MPLTMKQKRIFFILFISTFLFFLIFRGLCLWVRINIIPEPNDLINPNVVPAIADYIFNGALHAKTLFRASLLSFLFALASTIFISRQTNPTRLTPLLNILVFLTIMISIYTLYRLSYMFTASNDYLDFLLIELKSETLCLLMFFSVISISLAFLTTGRTNHTQKHST